MSDWWAGDPIVSTSEGGDWWKADPVIKGSGGGNQPTSWGDVAGSAIAHAPESALNFAKGVVQPIVHPIAAAKNLYNVGAGAIDMGAAAANAAVDPYLPKEMQELPEQTFGERYQHAIQSSDQTKVKSAENVGKYFEGRYGSMEGFKKAIATDPVGVLADLSSVLSLGGSAAARAPGMVGKIGEIAGAAGDVANPAMTPVKSAAGVGNEAARLGSSVTSPTTEALYDAATAAYDHPAIKELAVKPSSFKGWKDALLAGNDVVDEDLSPKTFKILSRLDNAPSGSFIDGRSIQSIRRKLGQAAGSADATERQAARDAIESLDDFIGAIPKTDVIRGDPAKVSAALADARGNYAAAKRSDRIEGKLEAANLQAGSANSGMNVDNATRQRMKDILKSDKLKRGFSGDELDQIRKISVGTPVQNLTRRVANILGGGGGIGSTVVGLGLGEATGHNVLGALGATAGYGLKRLSAAMTQADVQRLQELVRSRSPLGQQMQSSLGKFGKAATVLKGAPSAKNIARFMLASRNLSTNLADAGINVTPENIAGKGD